MGKHTKYLIPAIICGVNLLLMQAVYAAPPPSVTTAPYTISYSAKITDASGNPITTTQQVRFSIWNDADSNATSYLATGAINPLAPNYTGWQETYTLTPDSNGIFHVRLGSINTLPNFTAATQVYLEVDVKPNGAPDTSYQVLDPDGNTANLTDRFPFDSSAYTINADTVDNKDVGTGPNNIPSLDGTGLLPINFMPGGTNADTFVLDFDNTISGPAGSVVLQFGNALGKFLEYDTAAHWFNFNDNLNVSGNLTTTGTINGVTINSTTVGPYNQSMTIEPVYPGATLNQDGTANQGKLENFYVDTDGVPGNSNINYYHWTTQQAALQNIDIIARVTLPEGFVSWQATPVNFTYRTLDGLAADNQVDMTIEDTAGNPVTLTGASGLVSPTFTTANITFGGAPVFTAGQPITIKIKLTASNIGAADAGEISLNYVGR